MTRLAETPMVDLEPEETREWLDALDAVINVDGPERVHQLLERLCARAPRADGYLPYKATTAYLNTIPPERREAHSDGAIAARFTTWLGDVLADMRKILL